MKIYSPPRQQPFPISSLEKLLMAIVVISLLYLNSDEYTENVNGGVETIFFVLDEPK